MSKYGNGLSTKEVKELEIDEAREILKKYNASDEDTRTITDMIEQAYYLLNESYKYAELITEILKENGVTSLEIAKAVMKKTLEKSE